MTLLGRMLEEDFPGRDAIVDQMRSALARQIDSNGSLEFKVETRTPARTKYRVPVEAQGKDIDGTTIHFLLHVVDGRLSELELYKDDSSRVARRPTPDQLEVIALG
jgi:hypothetical protein